MPHYWMSIPDPNRKRCTLHLHSTTLLPQQEEGRFSPHPATAQPMRDCHNSASEKPLHFKLPVSSNGLFVYNSPSQLSFPLLFAPFSPADHIQLLYVPLHSPEGMSFISLNSTIFREVKVTGISSCHLRKRHVTVFSELVWRAATQDKEK